MRLRAHTAIDCGEQGIPFALPYLSKRRAITPLSLASTPKYPGPTSAHPAPSPFVDPLKRRLLVPRLSRDGALLLPHHSLPNPSHAPTPAGFGLRPRNRLPLGPHRRISCRRNLATPLHPTSARGTSQQFTIPCRSPASRAYFRWDRSDIFATDDHKCRFGPCRRNERERE